MKPILSVQGLSKIHGRGCSKCIETTGPEQETNICSWCGAVVAAHNVSFELHPGEILGIMGESGSGKSTVVKTLFFDEEPTSGSAQFVEYDHVWNLFELNAAQRRWLRNHRFGMVYQNPHLGLNFNVSAGGNIAERLLMSDLVNYKAIRERALDLLARTEVLADRIDDSPKKFSGGMQQRVQIAKALATQPPLLFLDEVTTGLDLSVQARILDLILEIQQELKTAMVVVTHDLGVIRLLTSRAMVMKYGRVIETGLTDQILEDPQHAYTQRLVASAL
ncbi:MAG: ATP-binding cassette domain-containing protein [Gammaproteobacteria bacterium]|uniref:ATP-binding cassette domain-containing protein n=1 Tax=Limnobacter sp. TaxID=2003368 RepID=UPI001D47DD17|nr:ATP-binding cassette domain-containing protein [Limnobacter sp.]MBU0785091.1 ATP-binding cassette domain-containing protein [Gammaproteobacteria bacterium]MBU0849129.1 ATP-binding cassette domain-containing protein [Gammaproteobacteria bacterium]MBU1267880.1 ATP-binding cassette domain-containing protein [Gammaproteobacteria bacterium]MBU1528365.1 ATP-binding cassette domain-containing protein [Gammaproteobacteria bacterium]MBU1781466.1 ATP-binding cassette domain-containing protein [Gammap